MANDNFQFKVIKGFCRYEAGTYNFNSETIVQDRQFVNMPEVMNGVYLNLVVLYKWIDSDKCNIQIGWEPADKNHAKLASPSDDLSYNFHNGTIKLLINGQEIPPTEKTTEELNQELDPGKLEQKTLYSCRMLNADNTSVLTSGYIRGYGDTLSGLSNIKTINIEFLYYLDSIYIPLNISDQDDFNSKILALNESLGDNYDLFKLNRVNNPTLAMGNPISKTSTYEDGGEYYYSAAPLAENITSENFNDQKELLCYWDSSTSKYVIAKNEEYDSNKIYHYRTRVISKIDITGNKAVRIQKPSKYEHNVVFNEAGLNELLANIKKYPVINIEEVSEGDPGIIVTHGNPDFFGVGVNSKTIKVGSNVKFLNANGEIITAPVSDGDNQADGTFRVNINNNIYQVPIKGLTGSSGSFSITVSGANQLIDPENGNGYAVGGTARPIYFSGGIPVACSSNVGSATKPVYMSSGTIAECAYTLGQNVFADAALTDTKNTAGATTTTANIYMIGTTTNTSQTFEQTYKSTSAYVTKDGYFYSTRVYNAVFNDYAEYRTTINLTPGHVVIDQDDGSLVCSSARLQPGAQVISDTFGHSMGETATAKTPLAVAGRVLVYTYQPRENYHAGMAVCSAPNGTVDIMTREEIRDYPDCIVGIVSEIPQYETWGSDNVKVDGRIWIKVK